ncbi:hypothetical protein DE146DRAFT_664146 [Phaeosphaeria sp. MPI-PUGE-AT-0046c]|nr:hypothetical protein DE146DRAFT_664146 [Phaeosphaeria sp. MPI-PUGE-AT-0046c]
MVKIAVVGGTGNVATELLRAPIRSGKHDITIFTRSQPPAAQPSGVSYKKVDYYDLPGLTAALQGFHTCLSFLIAHNDVDNTIQKNLIHACIASEVRRFAPSEWCLAPDSGVPAYANKDAIAAYLHDLRAKNELGNLEYCLFQPSVFMDYFAHPHPLSPNLITWQFFVDFENRRAMILDDGNYHFALTPISDISEMLALALDDPRPWPVIGSMEACRTTINELLALGKKIRGGNWTVEHVRSEDLEKGELKTSWVPRFSHPAVPDELQEGFSKEFVVDFLLAMEKGKWAVGTEWNERFPEYNFTGLEEYLEKAWGDRAEKALGE